MAYIGRDTDKISNIEKLDTITFDGSSSYTLQKNGVNFSPNSSNSLQVSIDGVVQAGNFTVSGSTIDFGVAIPSTSTCDFIFHYGTGLVTTVADGAITTAKLADSSVSLAKLTATGTKDATTFLRGDNTFATVSAGFTLDTAQTPTTNTASFTGIPSTARYIVLSISNLSFTGAGNTNFKVEIGDSGGLETTGYSNTVVYLSTNAGEASPGGTNYTDAFHFFYQPDQNNVWYGQIILSCLNPSTNTWVMQGNGATNSYCQFSAGTKSLSGTLTQLAVKTVNGANFDNGTLNIMYQ
tara:strand:+ start:1229 stop:2113 length:885 start_codon:yes stop_codon:yes gene_type:complete